MLLFWILQYLLRNALNDITQWVMFYIYTCIYLCIYIYLYLYIYIYIYAYNEKHHGSQDTLPLLWPRMQAYRLCNQFGVKMRANEKPGAHLPWDHPAIEAVRLHVQKLCASGEVHPRLVANFDQVWSTIFRPERKTLQKSKPGRPDPLNRSLLMRKVRHHIERSLDLPLTEADPGVKIVSASMRKPHVQGGVAASAAVEQWRVPRSVTTLSWRDGFVSRAFVTVRKGTMSEETRSKMNRELKKHLVIDEPQERSHVWTQETLVRYLSHLSQDRPWIVLSAGHQCCAMFYTNTCT